MVEMNVSIEIRKEHHHHHIVPPICYCVRPTIVASSQQQAANFETPQTRDKRAFDDNVFIIML